MEIPALPLLLGFLVGQRLTELAIASRNTRRLKAEGGVEAGARHYPLFIVLHVSWIAAMALFIPLNAPPNMALIGVFLLLQLGRVWVIATLGRYWTTRIITVPDAPLVRQGPYRFVKHPNYLIVAGEIAVLPLAFGDWRIAAIFSLANAALVLHRIRVEEQALKDRICL